MTKLTLYAMIVSVLLGINESAFAHTSPEHAALAGPRDISPQGTCYVVALFAKFSNETPDQTDLPDYAEHLFDADRPGSFTHFYHEMSLGRFAVEGRVLPKYYTSDRPASAYPRNEKEGYVEIFNREVLKKADREVDFSFFDNDGPDGVPNSGDDDGYVDYLFILVEGEYPGFLPGTAAGIAGLKLGKDHFVTNDRARIPSEYIKIASTHGATQKVSKYSAVGIMAHEFGHAPGLGLPDLYDPPPYRDVEDDGAGIGSWGLMGRGALGWNGHDPDGEPDGPVPFSAWSRVQLGWAKVEEITGKRIGQVLTDVATTGIVYKIPAGGSYYLLENRQSSKSYYDRNIPGSGLLIWHIQPSKTSNRYELNKAVDLVCADGLYRDRGYPNGTPDPGSGRDNLDFWAHNEHESYRSYHNGNLGDDTDPFDGIRFTAFTPHTNPSSKGDVWIEHIRPSGTDLIANIHVPTWSGSITGEVLWKGVVNVVGDIVVEKGAMLTICSGTEVRFSSTDALRGGADPDRCEIEVFGKLRFMWRSSRPIYLRVEGEGTWAGIRLYEGIASMENSRNLDIQVEDCDVPEGVFWVTEAEASSPPIEEREMEHGGEELVTDIGENDPLHPRSFALSQNAPNPFNAETVISFELPRSMDLTLTIFNALGQTVKQWQGSWTAGHHSLTWSGQDEDGAPVASGVYFYRLQAEDFVQTHAATLLR